jgi:hypothetical protein
MNHEDCFDNERLAGAMMAKRKKQAPMSELKLLLDALISCAELSILDESPERTREKDAARAAVEEHVAGLESQAVFLRGALSEVRTVTEQEIQSLTAARNECERQYQEKVADLGRLIDQNAALTAEVARKDAALVRTGIVVLERAELIEQVAALRKALDKYHAILHGISFCGDDCEVRKLLLFDRNTAG